MGIIYLVTNKINGKQYVGQTVKGLEKRKRKHLYDTETGRDGLYFHRAIRKYGEDAFEWEIIDGCEDEKELSELEIYYIQRYDTYENGYNLTLGGEGGSGRIQTKEARRKIGEFNLGKKLSEETKDKIRKANIGRTLSEETKQKMSESRKGKNNPNYGKHCTEKMIQKISKSQRGRGLFGFTGACYANKKRNPWMKVWSARITYKSKQNSLGVFQDPLSCQIVYDFVWNEIYNI